MYFSKWSQRGRVAEWVRSFDLAAHTSLSLIRRGFTPSFVSYKKGYTRLAAASDKVYQLLAQDRWFSPGTPASSTTKNWSPWYSWNTAESGIKTQLINQSINQSKWSQILMKFTYWKKHTSNLMADNALLMFELQFRILLSTIFQLYCIGLFYMWMWQRTTWSHWHTLSQKVVSSTAYCHEQEANS